MQYEIFGEPLPAVSIYLDNKESIYTQNDGMAWMSDSIQMDTNMKGGIMKSLGRMFTGESPFMATFTAVKDNSEITISSTFPGAILPLELYGNEEYICQKSAFLCATPSIDLAVEMTRGIRAGLFGGEGFLLQRITGRGIVFLELDGSIVMRDLNPGETLIVDTGNVAVFSSTVTYATRMVKGFKNVLFGGEGLFLTTLTGPGKVWLQTVTAPRFASRLIPFIPTNNNNN